MSSNHWLLITLALLLLMFGSIEASAYETPESQKDVDIVVNVDYTYELFYRQSTLDCSGTLEVTMNKIDDVKTFLIDRSTGHPSRMPFPLRHIINPSDSTTVYTIPDILWGVYFRVRAMLNDGTFLYSPTYYVSDYIDPADMELLKSQSGVDEIDSDPLLLAIREGALHVEVVGTAHIHVADISGQVIFSNDVHRTEEIPLDRVRTPFIIVRYTDSNQTITKKLAVK